MPGTRFSLLLLEPGEIYFEDFSVTHSYDGDNPDTGESIQPQRGRLRLCSKSIFFEPSDYKYSIIRICFSSCTSISQENDSLIVNCNQTVEMLKNNTVAPYSFKKGSFSLKFTFHYATNQECLHRLAQLHRASSLLPKEQQEMMEAIVHSRHSRVHFDPCWLEDLHECILFETRVVQVSPLVSNPGRMVLTSARLYYQPYNSEPFPVLKIRLSDIERIVRRRYLLQNSALEIYYNENCSTKYLFLALDSQARCDDVYQRLEQKANKSSLGLDVATLQWQHGVLSNYDYLLYLNSMADRSFNDLTQYPVFPWVIKDFTSPTLNLEDPSVFRDLSLPIGALNPRRLKQLLERFADMPEPRFLYGSHYMAPGFVLFYLARQHPQLVLCLHGGRFDHPDRMFNSLQQTWQNVINGAADYKELVPEFYDGKGDFLVNYLGIDFGRRSGPNANPVQDVELPPWASTPLELTRKLREALESEHVSRHLHQWIDLIFGYLQKGEPAIEAHNLFHPLCYEGSIDLATIRDPVQRHMYEIQILEFGQIPRQLFPSHPHPPRFAGLVPTSLLPVLRPNNGNSVEEGFQSRSRSWSQGRLMDLQLESVIQSHKKPITDFILASRNNGNALSISLDGFLKIHRLSDGQQMLSIRPIESGSPLTALINLPDSDAVVLGTLQNEIAIFHLDCCRLESAIVAHDDVVTALGITKQVGAAEEFLLASGSADSTIKIWRIRRGGIHNNYRFRPPEDLIAELEHEAPVVSLDFNSSGNRIASGTKEGHLQLWDIPSGLPSDTLSGHNGQVSAVKFSPDGSKLVSAGRDGLLQVFQVDIDPPHTLAKTSDTNEDFRCLVWDGLSILLGTARGDLLLFDLVEFTIVRRWESIHGNSPVNRIAVRYSTMLGNHLEVLTAGEDTRICLWKPKLSQ